MAVRTRSLIVKTNRSKSDAGKLQYWTNIVFSSAEQTNWPFDKCWWEQECRIRVAAEASPPHSSNSPHEDICGSEPGRTSNRMASKNSSCPWLSNHSYTNHFVRNLSTLHVDDWCQVKSMGVCSLLGLFSTLKTHEPLLLLISPNILTTSGYVCDTDCAFSCVHKNGYIEAWLERRLCIHIHMV